ncbi:hypothetical protein BGZ95_009635 [Linnemannia exigua]|uniref:Uncharacterized protein n=1 Tax=Linnemannia exigua TaxID=604196 RepID=A0AAD4DE89_9FUNG|nr:hypothetical protein BGZ95_009635 [Linnemannia exigua]
MLLKALPETVGTWYIAGATRDNSVMTGHRVIAGAVSQVLGGFPEYVRRLSPMVSMCEIRLSELGCSTEYLTILVRLTDLMHHRNSAEEGNTNIGLVRVFTVTGIRVVKALVRTKAVLYSIEQETQIHKRQRKNVKKK